MNRYLYLDACCCEQSMGSLGYVQIEKITYFHKSSSWLCIGIQADKDKYGFLVD